MPLYDFYRERIDRFQRQADRLQKSENRLSLARLLTFVAIFLLFFSLRAFSTSLAIAASAACIIVFGMLVIRYARTETMKQYASHLARINMLELQSISGDNSGFYDGSAYIDRDHPNSHDLDLFGHASVFQFMNRTCSQPGAEMLARWLMKPAGMDEIKRRQQAIAELRTEIDWRQQLMTTGYFARNSLNNPGDLLTWVAHDNEFPHPRRLRFITISLSTLGVLVSLFALTGQPAVIILPFLAVNFLVYFSQGTQINRLHQRVSKSSDLLQTYAAIMGSIEKKTFGAEKLSSLQQHFRKQPAASVAVKRLSQLVNRLDTRLNIMVSIPLNLFFFWDLHVCLALEKWKKKHAGDIDSWLAAMAEFEVLSSMANMAYNNPAWVMPEVVPGYFTFKAEKMGHPLIPAPRLILNDIEITAGGRVLVVTGSNMSGKSTFLRTCGVNTVLALAGAPVCAGFFRVSHVQVFSSMRISDSLEDNTSSFYAELKRLAAIIGQAEKDPGVFILLDEILRGTNSNDRYTGSVALIRQLISYGTVAVVATHDLKLADLAKELPAQIDNYHFDVRINGEELYFDYKLTPGVCTSLNASILMKKMGIKIM